MPPICRASITRPRLFSARRVETRRRVLGAEHPDTLSSMNYLGTVYWAQGKYAQAEKMFNQTLEIRRRVLGPEHPDTLKIHEQPGDRVLR